METKIVTDVEEVINYSKSYQALNPHHPIQIEVINSEDFKEFLTFCHNLAEIEYIDELSGWSRKRSDKLKFEDVIHKTPTGLKCGMKVNHYPSWKINPWEQWEDGFIEFFIRMDGPTLGNEIFIWQDVRMKYLPKIIKEFAYKLEYWKI